MKISIPACLFAMIFGLSLLPGCGKNPHTEKIVEVDSLLTELDHISAELSHVDSAKVYARQREQIKKINLIQQNMDTMDRETAFLIDRYVQYKKAYSKWGAKIPAFYEETELRKNQLADLKNDMVKELIDEEKANTYFSDEKQHVKVLGDIVHRMDSGLNSIESLYLEADSQVTEIVKGIEEKPAL